MVTIRSVANDTVACEGAEIPYTDLLSAVVLDDAVAILARLRQPGNGTDPRARLSCLVSLAAEAEAGFDEALCSAVDHGWSWTDVAAAMAETTEQVRQRYDCVALGSAADIDDDSIGVDDVPVPPAPPVTDEASAHALGEAVTSVILERFPLSLFDGLAVLNALESLSAQVRAAMDDARDQGHSWNDIATCLDVGPTTARRRHSGPARTRPEAPFED